MAARELPYGVRLLVAYDGTGFSGWQRQPEVRTVQSVLGAAVHRITPHHSRVRGASRTDAGVHAVGQVAAFDCNLEIPPRGWVHALNMELPGDVAVREAAACTAGYKPRFDARAKTYRYEIRTGETRDPLKRNRAWHVGPPLARRDVEASTRSADVHDWLDVGAMGRAAEKLVGTHDFGAFRATGDGRDNTERTLTAVRVRTGWDEDPGRLAVEVEGTAFLKHMVRILVGTLVDVGRHYVRPEDVDEMLRPEARRADAGPTAPAHGLMLMHVELARGDL